jgi:cytidyltransferase-like protein
MTSAALPVVRETTTLRDAIGGWRNRGLTVGLVPTMGALHEGHLSLVRTAKARCDRVVASLFVNPRQFAPHEDFERYPRDEAGDGALLAGAGCDLLYAPDRSVMYPDGFATNVIVSSVSTKLEGEYQAAFFRRRRHRGGEALAAGAAGCRVLRRERLSAAAGDKTHGRRSRHPRGDPRLPYSARTRRPGDVVAQCVSRRRPTAHRRAPQSRPARRDQSRTRGRANRRGRSGRFAAS